MNDTIPSPNLVRGDGTVDESDSIEFSGALSMVDIGGAEQLWATYSSLADVRAFFRGVARLFARLFRTRAYESLDQQIRALVTFADRVPTLSTDVQIQAYSQGAIDALLEQSSELLQGSSSSAERALAQLGRNHLSVIAALYDHPLQLRKICEETAIRDRSYASRLLQSLEDSHLVERMGKEGYKLTPAGIRAYSRSVEPGWTYKARRLLLLVLDRLDKTGRSSRSSLNKQVANELNLPDNVAERLVGRTLEELQVTGRLRIEGDSLVSLMVNECALSGMLRERGLELVPARG
jgi:DNA-binding MarR family transcriptional regulator